MWMLHYYANRILKLTFSRNTLHEIGHFAENVNDWSLLINIILIEIGNINNVFGNKILLAIYVDILGEMSFRDDEISIRWNVYSMKYPFDEIFLRRNVRSGNVHSGNINRWNVMNSAKCFDEMGFFEMDFGKKSGYPLKYKKVCSRTNEFVSFIICLTCKINKFYY
jgi:hypothetical protein